MHTIYLYTYHPYISADFYLSLLKRNISHQPHISLITFSLSYSYIFLGKLMSFAARKCWLRRKLYRLISSHSAPIRAWLCNFPFCLSRTLWQTNATDQPMDQATNKPTDQPTDLPTKPTNQPTNRRTWGLKLRMGITAKMHYHFPLYKTQKKHSTFCQQGQNVLQMLQV